LARSLVHRPELGRANIDLIPAASSTTRSQSAAEGDFAPNMTFWLCSEECHSFPLSGFLAMNPPQIRCGIANGPRHDTKRIPAKKKKGGIAVRDL
jgi:hypothetical protein